MNLMNIFYNIIEPIHALFITINPIPLLGIM